MVKRVFVFSLELWFKMTNDETTHWRFAWVWDSEANKGRIASTSEIHASTASKYQNISQNLPN